MCDLGILFFLGIAAVTYYASVGVTHFGAFGIDLLGHTGTVTPDWFDARMTFAGRQAPDIRSGVGGRVHVRNVLGGHGREGDKQTENQR